MTLTLRLPMPPSVNQMLSNAIKGRTKTKKYYQWIDMAGKEIMIQLIGKRKEYGLPLLNDVKVEMVMERVGDLDNRIKATLDLLTTHQIYKDDKQVCEIVARFGPVTGIEIRVTEAWTL